METIISLIVCGMLAASSVGCSNGSVEESPKEETKVEEQVNEKPNVLTIENDEEFKHYLTSSLEDEEYDKYFDKFFTGEAELQKVEFDAAIVRMDSKEGYDTRYELLIYPGDYTETEVTGPAMKVDDIGLTDLGGLEEKANVKIVGEIWGYDEDKSYVNLHIDSIESR